MPSARRPAALLSLSDRRGLEGLASALRRFGFHIVATTGTAEALRQLDLACEEVGQLTGFPPLFGGRVKTLHPKILGGILADLSNPEHVAELERLEIPIFSLVAVTLYPFEEAAAQRPADDPSVLEQIDIGGVTLLRAAAKNHTFVSALSSPDQYDDYIAALETGGPSPEQRKAWAAEAFALCERYDGAIARSMGSPADSAPRHAIELRADHATKLRYGENPWAEGTFFAGAAADGARLPHQLAGKELSYNNLLDLDACLRLISRLEAPGGFPPDAASKRATTAAIVKHTIPCGVAARDDAPAALAAALGADPISAFGGIVACSAPIGEAAAALLKSRFLEIVAAPDFDEAALSVLRAKRNLRVLRFDPALPAVLNRAPKVRSALGGVLIEEPDPAAEPDEWRLVTDRQPSEHDWTDLLFAFGIVRHVKSNAAVVVKDESALGICGGQTNRVSAVELACARAGDAVRGSVLATDGFFPFADGIEAAARAGVTSVVAPSGSIRDQEVVMAARNAGLSLVFTRRRYFLH